MYFIENVKLRKVILPKNLKEIEPVCFSDCYKLETVVLPDNLREIGHGSSCRKLNMQIYSKVKLGRNVFWDSPGVTIIEADSDPVCGCWTQVWQWISDIKEKTF